MLLPFLMPGLSPTVIIEILLVWNSRNTEALSTERVSSSSFYFSSLSFQHNTLHKSYDASSSRLLVLSTTTNSALFHAVDSVTQLFSTFNVLTLSLRILITSTFVRAPTACERLQSTQSSCLSPDLGRPTTSSRAVVLADLAQTIILQARVGHISSPLQCAEAGPPASIRAHWYNQSAPGTTSSDSSILWHLGFGQPQNTGFGTGSGSTLFGGSNTSSNTGGFGSGTSMARAVTDRPLNASIFAAFLQSEFAKGSTSPRILCKTR